MSKSILGRGLGDLLGSDRAQQQPTAPPRAPGVGLRILIEGAPREVDIPQTTASTSRAAMAPNTATSPAKEKDSTLLAQLLAVAGLAGADFALLGWAGYYVFTHANAATSLGLWGCAGSVLLAAVCGCAAAALISIRID
ncbi:MAG TPA: hypothetical protein VK846_00045 [Candidatus Limnocylindria bacterium]|nr:hypothetical protein [Candidatus Limnocylindria bacterium]